MVYIIKFERPIGSSKHKAQYYIGYCRDGHLKERLEDHRSGRGAKILKACVEQGISFKVIKTYPKMGRAYERELKNKKNIARFLRSQGIIS